MSICIAHRREHASLHVRRRWSPLNYSPSARHQSNTAKPRLPASVSGDIPVYSPSYVLIPLTQAKSQPSKLLGVWIYGVGFNPIFRRAWHLRRKCFVGVFRQVKIWFQNRRSKVKKMTKHGGGSAAHSTMTDADCSVSGTDDIASSDDDQEHDVDDQQQPETRDSDMAATPPADHCISPPSLLTAQHSYLPSNLPPSQIPAPPPSSSSSYFMPPVVPDWTDFPPPPPPPIGVIPPAYTDYFYPSNAAAAMAGYHAASAAGGVGVPHCPSSAGPYHHWYTTGPSQQSMLAWARTSTLSRTLRPKS